jgi:3-methyl-2-oxobutanoate hydroxymethyltransferase
MNVLNFRDRKLKNEKLSMVTCYDSWSAKLIAKTPIDIVLVGDSAAMVMHGYSETLPATNEMMRDHVAAVRRGAPEKFIVADMPFLSFRGSLDKSVEAVRMFMQAGANAVKLEGAFGNESLVEHLVHSGVPVMGHLGLTPQSVNTLGGHKVQGRSEDSQQSLLDQAQRLERAGCFSLVLECVPFPLATRITGSLAIPTIGIGAGIGCDGQVLVLQDMLGMNEDFKPKFLRTYINGAELVKSALESFHKDVVTGQFPGPQESYE